MTKFDGDGIQKLDDAFEHAELVVGETVDRLLKEGVAARGVVMAFWHLGVIMPYVEFFDDEAKAQMLQRMREYLADHPMTQ